MCWWKTTTKLINCVGVFDSYGDTKKREMHMHQVTSMMLSEFQVRLLVEEDH